MVRYYAIAATVAGGLQLGLCFSGWGSRATSLQLANGMLLAAFAGFECATGRATWKRRLAVLLVTLGPLAAVGLSTAWTAPMWVERRDLVLFCLGLIACGWLWGLFVAVAAPGKLFVRRRQSSDAPTSGSFPFHRWPYAILVAAVIALVAAWLNPLTAWGFTETKLSFVTVASPWLAFLIIAAPMLTIWMVYGRARPRFRIPCALSVLATLVGGNFLLAPPPVGMLAPVGVLALLIWPLFAGMLVVGRWFPGKSTLEWEPDSATRFRSPAQFGVREILVMMLAVGVGVAAFRARLAQAETQRAASANGVSALGIFFGTGASLLPFVDTHYHDRVDRISIASADAESARRLAKLPHVDIWHFDHKATIGPGVIAAFASRERSTQLDLRYTNVNDEMCREIAQAKSLHHLDIDHTPITAKGLAEILPHPSLYNLGIDAAQLDQRSVAGLNGCPNLTWLKICFEPGEGRQLEWIANLRNVPRISIVGHDLTDDDLVRLENATHLESLGLTGKFTAVAIDRLYIKLPRLGKRIKKPGTKPWPGNEREYDVARRLYDLNLWLTASREGTESITGISAGRLPSANRPISDEDLCAIATLESLEMLDLMRGTQVTITDRGVAYLAGHPTLEVVHLPDCGITDAGVSHLAALPRLSWLHVEGQTITDACIDALVDSNVQYLFIFRTAITPAGRARLRREAPHIDIR